MWNDTKFAVLNSFFSEDKISTTTFPQSIQRAIAKQAAEFFKIIYIMARKIFAFNILEKIVAHGIRTPSHIDVYPLFG